jgi:hypothetical protein
MFKKLLHHKFVGILSVASFLLSLTGFIWAYCALRIVSAAGQPLILHFNDIRGITQVGGVGLIVFMGVFGMVVTVADGCIALAFDERDAAFGKLIAVLTFIFAALLFIGFASIISVN